MPWPRRDGRVLGCTPCDAASSAWLSHVPLAGLTRGEGTQRRQEK